MGKAVACKHHREDGTINVIKKRCDHSGCMIHPGFGFRGKLPRFCVKHKLHGMVNVVIRRCLHVGCKKSATFGYVGKIRPLRCKKHSLTEMVGYEKMLEYNREYRIVGKRSRSVYKIRDYMDAANVAELCSIFML